MSEGFLRAYTLLTDALSGGQIHCFPASPDEIPDRRSWPPSHVRFSKSTAVRLFTHFLLSCPGVSLL